MAVTSYIAEEGHGHGKGHIAHGNGKGLGHQKHAQNAMEDGVYTIKISDVEHDNPTPVDHAPDDSRRWFQAEYRGTGRIDHDRPCAR